MLEVVKTILIPSENSNEPIISPDNARTMCYISFLFAFTAIYAIARGHYYYALIPIIMLISSLNYWRHPTIGWRRTLDIFIVCAFVLIICTVAINNIHGPLYFLIFFTGVICYFISYYFYINNDHDRSTFMHGVLHIFANMGLILLYATNLSDPLLP